MSLINRISWLLLLLPVPAAAQAVESATDDFFDDGPQILTASRMSKPLLESPASVSVIDRDMIESSGVRDLADLFRLVPGFVVGYHSAHAPAVSYHGLGQEFGRQMQVLIDGRSVFIPSFGGVPWSNLPLLIEDIERIEVIRGPNAVTYGANAFLATVNIITRDAAEDVGIMYSVSNSDNSSPDIEDAYLRIGSHFSNVDWRLSLGAIADEGFGDIKDSKRTTKANFRIDLAASSNQLWTIQFGSSDSEAGRGFPQSDDNLTDIERTEDASNEYINLKWEGVWDTSTSIARLTHTRQDVTDHYDPGSFTLDLGAVSLPGVTTFIDFDRTSERTEIEFVQTEEIGSNLRLVYGGSLRQDRVRSLFLLNQRDFDEVDTERMFAGIEWRFNRNWLLDVGVMLEDSNLTDREASPRISLIRKFGRVHALRLVASAAKRNPILWESDGETEFSAEVPLFGTVVLPTWTGNEDVDPESIVSYEIGLRSQLGGGFGSDIKIFSYDIDDHIITTTTPIDTGAPLGVVDVGTASNGEETEVTGIEVALDYTPDKQLEIHAGFSIVEADSSQSDLQDSIPDYTGFVTTVYRINDQHEVSAYYYYLDEISWLDSGRDIAVARRLDLRYAYHLVDAFNIEIIGQNLLEDFADYEDENIHDQVIYLRLSGEF